MMRKLIFFDIDGTLAMPGDPPTPATVRAIRVARKRGHIVLLSTGRARHFVPEAIAAIGFDGGVYSAGGLVRAQNQVLSQRVMPEEMVRQVIELLESEEVFFTLEGVRNTYRSAVSAQIRACMEYAGVSSEMRRMVEQTWMNPNLPLAAQRTDEEIYKVSFFASSAEQMDRLTRAVRAPAKLVRFDNLTEELPVVAGEISDPAINKGDALRTLCEFYGASPADCIAFGDSMNDAEMLCAAGVGIAMGNAEARVKALADRICESVAEDGVAKELARLGLA